jgi:hypothetical protein
VIERFRRQVQSTPCEGAIGELLQSLPVWYAMTLLMEGAVKGRLLLFQPLNRGEALGVHILVV